MDKGKSLSHRTAVITGAARGLGLAFAHALSSEGANVVVADVDETQGMAAVKELSAENRRVLFHKTDVSKRHEIRCLIDTAVHRFHSLDILINNAGLQYISPICEFDEDRWDYLISVMLTGTFLASRYALPHMMSAGRGRIINIASVHGLVASEFKAAYVAAKHGVVGFTKALALEGAPYNITAVAVCPSYVQTALVEKQISEQAKRRNIPPGEVVEKVMLAPAALKRLIQPDEVASLVAYLCSDAAQVITGTAITMDCGWTAR
ncbi:MAG TPA: 3-hydroxybutyrate dehydrogenase [Terriglobia bacterium]|nr:3-hydroxybutyrate dehydrogenase [Terriglobia bacterium]